MRRRTEYPDLFETAESRCGDEIEAGMKFTFGGRTLRVISVHGEDAQAPVVTEELSSFGQTALRGQLSLWSASAVQTAGAIRRRNGGSKTG